MTDDQINGLISALKREVVPDETQLKEILILSGMPEKSENLKYLGFNGHIIESDHRSTEFSAIAVINNHRVDHWRLDGLSRRLNRFLIDKRWTRNPVDIFISNLRCSSKMMNLLAESSGAYTLLGMLRYQVAQVAGAKKRKVRHIRPILAVSGIDGVGAGMVAAFETANEIRTTKIKGLPFHRQVTKTRS